MDSRPLRVLTTLALLSVASEGHADPALWSRENLVCEEEIIAGSEYVDVDRTRIFDEDTVRIDLEYHASSPNFGFHAPLHFDAHHDPGAVQPGQEVWVWLQARTYDDAEEVLVHQFGVTGLIYLGRRNHIWGDLYTPWAEISFGWDFSVDIERGGTPPMWASEPLTGVDRILSPASLGITGINLAGIDIGFVARMRWGSIGTRATVVGGELLGPSGPVTFRDLTWYVGEVPQALRIRVPSSALPGDEVVVQLGSIAYDFTLFHSYSAIAAVLGYDLAEVAIGTLFSTESIGDESFSVTLTVPYPDPELRPGSFATVVHPDRMRGDQDNLLIGAVRNGSTVDVGSPFDVRLRVRRVGSATWEATETRTLASLASNAVEYVRMTVPAGTLGAGLYEVEMTVDTADSISERDETNNTRTMQISILDPRPNLEIVRGGCQQSPREGVRVDQPLTVSCSVESTALDGGESGPFDVELQYWTGAGWEAIGRDSVSNLAPGATASVSVDVPADTLRGGGALVRAIADVDELVQETRERDNSESFLVHVRSLRADLETSSLDMSFEHERAPVPRAGDDVTIWLSVANVGGENVPAGGQVRFERSTPSGVEPLCGGCNVPLNALRAGESGGISVRFRPDEDGPWAIRATVEAPPGAMEESTENNRVERTLQVGDPVGAIEGRVLDADGAPFAGARVEVVPGGPSATSASAPLPGAILDGSTYRLVGVNAGLRTIRASADGYVGSARITEVLSGRTVRADFRMASLRPPNLRSELLSAPEAPAPGDAFGVDVRIENHGDLDVAPGEPVLVRVFVNGDPVSEATHVGGVPARGEARITDFSGEPFATLPGGDTFVAVTVDPDDTLVEANELDNTDADIVTNANPRVSITDFPTGPVDAGVPQRFTGTASDPAGLVLHTSWHSSLEGLLGSGTEIDVALGAGTHRITLRALDELGELGHDEVEVVVRDVIGPRVEIVYASGLTLRAPGLASFRFFGRDDVSAFASLDYAWRLEGVEDAYGEWSSRRDVRYTELASGSYELVVKARDEAGNESAQPARLAFVVVAAAPSMMDGGVPDAGTTPPPGDGCGCRVGPNEARGASLVAFAIGLLLVVFRRRSRTGSHRFFDHTGDFGADLEATSEAELYEAGVDALIALMVENPATIEERERRELQVSGIDEADLLVALANEVLFAFETGWLARRVEVVSLDDEGLSAVAHGEPFAPARHPIARPTKAVTHHGASVRENDDGTWSGRLIFDL